MDPAPPWANVRALYETGPIADQCAEAGADERHRVWGSSAPADRRRSRGPVGTEARCASDYKCW